MEVVAVQIGGGASSQLVDVKLEREVVLFSLAEQSNKRVKHQSHFVAGKTRKRKRENKRGCHGLVRWAKVRRNIGDPMGGMTKRKHSLARGQWLVAPSPSW